MKQGIFDKVEDVFYSRKRCLCVEGSVTVVPPQPNFPCKSVVSAPGFVREKEAVVLQGEGDGNLLPRVDSRG